MANKSILTNPLAVIPIEDRDPNRSPPTPNPDCLYGLVGDIAKAGSATSEANPFAIALNAIVYIGCAIGRNIHLLVGDTQHHPRIFGLHVGGSGRGRKGDALALCRLLHKSISSFSENVAPGVHYGGLSSAEGLVHLIHDGYMDGKNEVQPVLDKRLWVVESEFANVLQQTKREGNTLSSAIRNLYDGAGIRPATKNNRIGVDEPHVCISGGITPSELRSALPVREITNGFSNRILMIWAERTRSIPFPEPTPDEIVQSLALRIVKAVEFSRGHGLEPQGQEVVTLTEPAKQLYSHLYTVELCSQNGNDVLNALLERRAPTLLRLAMIFAITDMTMIINENHIRAAAAWTRYWAASVGYIFASVEADDRSVEMFTTSEKILKFLDAKESATRTELSAECFGGHLNKQKIDQALEHLLTGAPPKVVMESIPRSNGAGSPTKRYRLVEKLAKPANCVLTDKPARGFLQINSENCAKPEPFSKHRQISQSSHMHPLRWTVCSPLLGH